MKVILSQSDIKQACREYVERQGMKPILGISTMIYYFPDRVASQRHEVHIDIAKKEKK
jgi:hypothetical protein